MLKYQQSLFFFPLLRVSLSFFLSLSCAQTVFDNLEFHGITNLVEHPAQMAPPGIT